MIEGILEYLATSPPGAWAGPLLGVIAFTETLFPPIPGDILFIVISGWAVSGGLSLMMVTIYGVSGCFMAGSSGMRFSLAVIPIALGAIAWYLLLSSAGSIFGSNIEAAEGFMKHFEIWLWIILAIASLIFLIAGIRRRKEKR